MTKRNNNLNSNLEKKIREKHAKKWYGEILKEHDGIVEIIRKKCLEYGYDVVKAHEKYVFSKILRPEGINSNSGEIDVYAINHEQKRIVIFEIKTGNGYKTAKSQLKRAEFYLKSYLKTHNPIYKNYRFCKIYISAELKDSNLKFHQIQRIRNYPSKYKPTKKKKITRKEKRVQRKGYLLNHNKKM